MYAFIHGVVAEKGQNELVIEAGGVGYSLVCSMNTLQSAVPVGEVMRAYTRMSVAQDGTVTLFGFATKDERAMFDRLTGISGIGPRTAIGILGSMNLRELTLAIVMGDTATLSRAPGIGKKTAQRIALELKEQITTDEVEGITAPALGAVAAARKDDPVSEAILALQSLGYTQGEAMQALSNVKDKSDQADELVRLALRNMM
ncbi:MAG: Holliday junction branch migration protein RuvA [Clostridia bacterium]|nr:Holliday junction branch migration protein RuvA [Clostridia bacterium]